MSTELSAAQERLYTAAVRLFAEKGTTQLSVSELAEAAGVARGTVYNNLASLDSLFEDVAAQLADEMHERVTATNAGVTDPAVRLANGCRLFIRRAHEEPDWGRFMVRFAMSNASLRGMWSGAPMRDAMEGLEQNRYKIRPEQLPSMLVFIGGGVLAAMALVLEGHRTWRDAGTDAMELALRGLGLPGKEARKAATSDLPPLAPVH